MKCSSVIRLRSPNSDRQLSMPHQHPPVTLTEVRRKRFHEVDRAVMPSGAADGDGEIAAAVAVEARQPLVDETLDVGAHLLDARIGFAELHDGLVAAGEGTQLRV